MNNYNCNCGCRLGCAGLALIASAIIGVVAAFLSFAALITVTPAFLWVLFGIAVGTLGITLLGSSACPSDGRYCCRYLRQLIAGILGTVLTSVILLGITFAATSIVGAIITGLLLFFFSLTITSAACLVKCRYDCD